MPDIDIHIIPDTVQAENYRKRHYEIHWKHPSARDLLLTLLIFTACTVIGLLFEKLHFTDTNVVTIYILGVLLTSVLTDGYFCSLAGSFLSAFLFCFFLTEPRMSFQTYAVGYPVTLAIMLLSSVIAGTLAAKLKTHAKISAQQAFRTQILFDTDRQLQQAKSKDEMLDITCTQLTRLMECSIVTYVARMEFCRKGLFFLNRESFLNRNC